MTAIAEDTVTDEAGSTAPDRTRDLLSGLTPPTDPVARGFWRIVGELVGAAVVAVLVSLVVQYVLSRPHLQMPSYAPQAVASFVIAVLVLGGFWLAARARFTAWTRLLVWAGISALTSAVLSLMLVGTRFYLAGIAGDQLFRIEYTTRLTNTAGFADFAYPNMPGYYPRGWFWLAGRVAALLHVEGWVLYKPYAIATMAVGTVLAYVAWCLVVKPAHALLATFAVATVAVATWAANEPYAWIFGALLPPLTVLAWKYLVRPAARTGPRQWTPLLLLGLLLGLYGLFYTLLLGFFIMVLVLVGVVGVVLDRRSGTPLWTAVRPVLLRLIGIGLVSLPLLLLQWAPYLGSALGSPTDSGADRFLPSSGASFPIFNYPTSFAGVLCLIGLVWGVLRLRDDVVARTLMLVAGAGYLWYGLSFLGTVAHLTLLPFKIELVMDETLRCAGVFGLVEGARWLWGRVGPQWRVAAVSTVTVLSLIGVVGELQSGPGALSELVTDAYSGYYPTGDNALGQHDPAQNGAWNQQLHDTIAAMTGKPENQLEVLSTYQDFLAFYPYWNFQTTVLEYANPLAQFDQRRETIQGWAKSPSPTALRAALASSPFGAPNVFVFTREADGLHLTVSQNVFPAAEDNHVFDVVFPASLFDSSEFSTRQVGPFTVVARH
ncbi:MAG TPA: arabinofuranosyltransferase [Pseudonocardiaceae bacterium]|jgi:galactan 5-O-arabinofuranosyltransferase|nr:arabinofuranosyltransferase [Pseudonocardiaceae bacterium]